MKSFQPASRQIHPSRERERARVAGAARPPLPCVLVIVIVLFASVSPLRAEHAVIDLRVIGTEAEVSAGSDQEPPAGGVNPRPLMKVRVGDPLILHFILTNVYPHGNLKDVKVRYYIVRVDQVRQKTVPPLDDEANVVTHGELTMNFKPKCRAGARLRFRVSEPGIYLVRVDTKNTQSDHEHFSSIDLEVVE